MPDETLIEGPTKWIKRNGRARRVPVNSEGLERQHWLLSKEAVTIGEGQVARLTDDEAYAIFEEFRFAETKGVPFCPYCGTKNAYRLLINRRTKAGIVPTRLYKCRWQKGDKDRKPCAKQFSVTSGTEFHSRKMSIRDILYALIIFTDGASGVAALRLRRALFCDYKTAFVLSGKIREAIHRSRDQRRLSGKVEVDGTEVGGHSRKASVKVKGREQQGGPPSERNALVGLRERRPTGESRIAVFGHESHYRDPAADTDFIRDNVVRGSNMVSDEGFQLGYIGPHETVKHKEGYKIGGVHTNGIEGLFSRLKRAENGVHYGWGSRRDQLALYGAETSWREDYRRRSNKEQWHMLIEASAAHFPENPDAPKRLDDAPVFKTGMWRGYWQRWRQDDPSIRRRHHPDEKARRRARGARIILAWERQAAA